MEAVLVSIIVPAYNVETYIDTCMRSIIKQTYCNLEILLINDGSTDETYERCVYWGQKDKRVKVFSKENEGLGPTRNYGISRAKGKYVFFVDSDDWIANDTIEHLVNIAENHEADIVAGDYTEYDSETQVNREVHLWGFQGREITSEYDKKEYLMRGWVMVWCKLYRRDFLKENGIYMPTTLHEDNAIFPIVALMARKIVYTSKVIYFYRINRSGSIICNSKSKLQLPKACENFLLYFNKKGCFSKYYPVLKRYAETRVWYAHKFYVENDQMENAILLDKIRLETYPKYFGNKKAIWEYQFGLLGGFGSRYIVQQVGVEAKQLVMHYPFSSLVAQMTTSNRKIIVKNENLFRREKILADYKGDLICKLLNKGELPDFIFIDFIEERYDIAELDDGNYITLSEAFVASEIPNLHIKRKIQACSEEYMDIWKEKCENFVKVLKSVYIDSRVILIRNRLTTQILQGDEYLDYSNLDNIVNCNNFISRMENFFLNQYGEHIQTFDIPEKIYSSRNFKFGAEPQYMADEIYKKIATEISVTFDNENV